MLNGKSSGRTGIRGLYTIFALTLVGSTMFAYSSQAQVAGQGHPGAVRDIPFTATQWTTRTSTDSKGVIVVTTQQIDIARSSSGAVRREIHEATSGADHVAGKGSTVVSTLSSDRQSVNSTARSAKAVTSIKFPEAKSLPSSANSSRSAVSSEASSSVSQIVGVDLGSSELEGFKVIGRRTKSTTPTATKAASPSNVTSEVWYSPELHFVLKSSSTDSSNNTTTMVVTDIKRAEPDSTLF